MKIRQNISLYIGLVALLSCTDEAPPLPLTYLLTDYRQKIASRRFDQCTIHYAFRNKSKTADPATLQKELEVPFDRWSAANGYLTFERMTATNQPADISIVFTDTLRSGRQYTSFGLIGQPTGVVSQLVKAKTDSSCTIYLLGTHTWNAASLQRVLLFHIGAALGLATSSNPASAMSGQVLNTLAVLDSSDISAIQRVYSQPCDSWTRLKDLPFGSGYSVETTTATATRGYVLLRNTNAFWEFDPASATWQSKATYPASIGSITVAPSSRLAFATDSAVFIGDSYNSSWLRDKRGAFWQYTPVKGLTPDRWTRIDSLGQVGFAAGRCFTLNKIAYLVSFRLNANSEEIISIWTYNPATGKWDNPNRYERLYDFHTSLEQTVAFALKNEAFIVSSESTVWKNWRFAPFSDVIWAEIPTFENRSSNRTGFAIRNSGYSIIEYIDGLTKRVWRYELNQNWQRMKDFPGSGHLTFSFVVGNRAFVGTNSNQFWQYTP